MYHGLWIATSATIYTITKRPTKERYRKADSLGASANGYTRNSREIIIIARVRSVLGSISMIFPEESSGSTRMLEQNDLMISLTKYQDIVA